MGKKLLITEKPSVAMEFAKALKINTNRKNGYLESEDWIITWCVGHLVTMSYPEKYDEKLKFWRLDTLPFIPTEWKSEIYCYEFKGKIDETEFLVYVNAKNGREENILVIRETPGGILTM